MRNTMLPYIAVALLGFAAALATVQAIQAQADATKWFQQAMSCIDARIADAKVKP